MKYLVTLLNAKGGVGKTTSSIHLATALAPSLSTEVWDADPQGSASSWAWTARESGDPLPFPCRSVNQTEIKHLPLEADITFLDAPPQNPAILNMASDRADLIVIPAAPSAGDLERVFSTIDASPEGTPSVVLLTSANPRTKLYTQTLETLDAEGVRVFETPIRALQVLRQNWNKNPKELAGYDQVGQELTNILKENK